VKPGIVGVTNATKSDNMGTFDYAHLRVPLPKDLNGSGIFTLNRTSAFPESYFLMVRDGNTHVQRAMERLTRQAATEQRRLHQRDRHVQGRLSLGVTVRGGSRAEVPEDFSLGWR
jgi:hypothetical protein